ncbi:MAG TPA: hypothetical protein VM452_11190, partial [Caulifigura sp.]|nr:hypothetical protein [Caulifigura sp.]
MALSRSSSGRQHPPLWAGLPTSPPTPDRKSPPYAAAVSGGSLDATHCVTTRSPVTFTTVRH